MAQVEEGLILSLRKVRNGVGALDPHDRETLVQVGAELEQILADVPEELSSVVSLLSLCLEGLQAIYQQSVPDLDALAQTIAGAMVAAEQGLSASGNPLCELMVHQAYQSLRDALSRSDAATLDGREQQGTVISCRSLSSPAVPCYSPPLSLDDIAALVVQLEPADLSEWERVRDALNSLEEGDSPPALAAAAQLADELAQGKASDAPAVIATLGRLIEQMQLGQETAENDRKQQETAGDGRRRQETIRNDRKQQEMADDSHEPIPSSPVVSPSSPTVPCCSLSFPAVPSSFGALPPDADPHLLGEYIVESRDYIEGAEAALLALETNPDDAEAINVIFRAFHTIKGTSAFLGVTCVAELAHRAESLFSRIRDREIRYGGGYADLALRSVDMLKLLLRSVQNALGGEPMGKPEGYDELMRLLADPEAAGISGKPCAEPTLRVGEILVGQGKAEREEVDAVAAAQGEQPIGVALVKSEVASTAEVAQALRIQQRLSGISDRAADSTVRVRTDRLDRLIDMVGELVIAHSMIAQDETVVGGGYYELQRKVSHAGKIVRELQDLSMSMRMVPLKATFQKMARLVRDLAHKSGKIVEFIPDGEDTEIDRNMVDIVSDPLVHMIRNAVDHGIERPEEREQKGKPKAGRVYLSAYHAGGNVVLELRDDGKGLDRDKIVRKAMERGLIESDKGMSDHEIYNLIFAPGFSTADKVTDVSGRGVGMDVVRRNVEALRGRVDITSEPGQGCTFSLRLPLTLAITDGMLVRVGAERYIIPTVNIHLSFRPTSDSLSTVAGRGEMVMLRGELMPLFRLHRLFGTQGAVEDPTQGLLVIVGDGERRCALLVDELLGQQQVVAKSLGEGLGKIQGVSGGAILGDGQVGLILDVPEMTALARRVPTKGEGLEETRETAA